ncbi:formyl-CoA transferase [Tamaricihabitans halophyticus]|uniref:Formyl-CoA transferase n=1 Tax=Tamaricihabitans halophyticus TaxID=1262583 RepID=A0A4R2R0Z0_9PSEU|nr:CoA transferase [Tamaricihabitans halophyticus]TCP56330.1 formyl-CoA transferase [Tamaricihabitans halophyticus]
MSENGARGPLAGIRVADFSRVLAGPYCTMLLADLGAEVIKVERPEAGDDTRAWGPPEVSGESAYFLAVNRGKRSIALDLAAERDRDIALALCQSADIVVENFRPGVADRLGIGYETVKASNPGAVYCSIQAYPPGEQPDPRAGLDAIIQAQSGLMSITGETSGEPTKIGVALVDVLTGLNAATAILAALHGRSRTGKGEYVTVALLSAALSGLVNIAQNALTTGIEPGRHGNAHPSIVPYQPFEAADGALVVAAGNDAQFGRLCQVLELPGLPEDARFATNPERVRNRVELLEVLGTRIASWPAEELTARLSAAGVPASRIYGVLEALREPETRGAPATMTVQHPKAGDLELVRPAFRLASTEVGASLPPPLLGEHTAELLAQLTDETP